MAEAARRSLYVVQDEFNHMYGQARENGWTDKIPCDDNPGPFVDWEVPPSAEAAERLCAPCPIKKPCAPGADVFRLTEKRPRHEAGVGVSQHAGSRRCDDHGVIVPFSETPENAE